MIRTPLFILVLLGLVCLLAAVALDSPEWIRALAAFNVAMLCAWCGHFIVLRLQAKGDTWQMIAFLGGGVVRTFSTLLCGLIVYFAVPVCQTFDFWICLLVTYLLALALEVGSMMQTLAKQTRSVPVRNVQHELGKA